MPQTASPSPSGCEPRCGPRLPGCAMPPRGHTVLHTPSLGPSSGSCAWPLLRCHVCPPKPGIGSDVGDPTWSGFLVGLTHWRGSWTCFLAAFPPCRVVDGQWPQRRMLASELCRHGQLTPKSLCLSFLVYKVRRAITMPQGRYGSSRKIPWNSTASAPRIHSMNG